jgi:hypothetical protein
MIEGDEEIARTLRRVLPPRRETALKRDLWPEVVLKISGPRATTAQVDWALAGVAALWLFVFPRALSALLYLL